MPDTFIHKNGGGKLSGPDGAGFVSSDSFLSPDSEVRGGNAVVSCLSTLLNRSIIEDCTVVNSALDRTIALRSHIHHAQVAHSILQDVVVRGANNQISDLLNVSLSNSVVVENCRLRNFELSGPHLVHVDFDRAPRNRVLQIDSYRQMALTECSDDHFHVGCKCRPRLEWYEKEPLLRKYFVGKLGWPLPVFNSIHETFEKWRADGARYGDTLLPTPSSRNGVGIRQR